MRTKNCPNCDGEMEHIENEFDVGINGGWYCSECNEGFPDEDGDHDESDF